MPPQQGGAQVSAAGGVPQLAGMDLMAILQSVGIQPVQQGAPTEVKQEQQAGMQVRNPMPPQALHLLAVHRAVQGMCRALPTEACVGALRPSSLSNAHIQATAPLAQYNVTVNPAYEGPFGRSLKLESDTMRCALQAPMLAGEMEHIDHGPAPNGHWPSQGSMPSMQQVSSICRSLPKTPGARWGLL